MFVVIIFYEELRWPQGWDTEYPGCLTYRDDSLAVFASRAEARKAIEISRLNAKLKIARGEWSTSDYTDPKVVYKVVPLKAAK